MKLKQPTICWKPCKSRRHVLQTFFCSKFKTLNSASDALRSLRIVQRKCMFNDESIEKLPVYSYNICNLVCRAKAALRLCGCRPYYYPFFNGTNCSPAGLLCLSMSNWPTNIGTCGCSKTCAEIVYTQGSLKKINWL